MGLEIVFGLASLAIGVISGVNQMASANATAAAGERSASLARESAAAEREANEVYSAQTRNNALAARRDRVREERVRRAYMINQSTNTGTGASSGLAGGLSAMGSNFGSLISLQYGNTKANEGINRNRQRAADLGTEARVITANAGANAARADAFSSFLGIFQSGFKSFPTIFDQD